MRCVNAKLKVKTKTSKEKEYGTSIEMISGEDDKQIIMEPDNRDTTVDIVA